MFSRVVINARKQKRIHVFLFLHLTKLLLFSLNNLAVMAMEDLARSFNNPPHDWSGDPCLPKENSWSGVTCSVGKLARVVNL